MKSVLAVVALSVCAGLSCDWFEDPVEPNLYPETTFLTCASSVDVTEGDDVVLEWNGSDVDGEVAAFEWSYDDGGWMETTGNTETIEGVTLGDHVFRVRAVDDEGAADPTPAECSFSAVAGGELVDRVVLVEFLTSTSCQYCPNSEQALNNLIEEFGAANLCVVSYHAEPDADDLATEESVARVDWYMKAPGFPGEPDVLPTVVFGGLHYSQGAETVGEAENLYRVEISNRLQVGSPISIRLGGELSETAGSLSVKVRVEDQLPSNPMVLRLAVIEDNVFSIGVSATRFDFVVRDMLDEEIIDLAAIGDSVVVERRFTVEGPWKLSDLDAVVFVEDPVEKEILQAARLKRE